MAVEFSAHARMLSNTPVFFDIPVPYIDDLIKRATTLTIPPDSPILEENALVTGLHILLEGKVQILKEGKNQVAELEQGSFFGELSLFGQSICATATVTSHLGSTILLVHRRELEEWFKKDHETEARFFRNLATELCNRLIATTERLNFALIASIPKAVPREPT